MTANIHMMGDPCWTCRRRTIRCDRSRVPCFKCEKAGLECLDKRPLRWVKGVAIRGKMRGKVFGGVAGVADEAHCLTGAQPRRNRVWTDFMKRAAVERSPSLSLQDPRMASLDRQSRFYIDYYNKRVCKLYILYDSDSNPFRTLLAYASEDATLQTSIISLAARHYANTGLFFDAADAHRSPRFAKAQLDALRCKGQAIKALSESMSRPSTRNKDATMATILLLIFLDILESGMDGWSFHIRGVKLLYQSTAQSSSHGNDEMDRGEAALELRSFIFRQLSLIETLGATFSDSTSLTEYYMASQSTSHKDSIVRSFLGCPEFFLRAIWFLSNQRVVLIESRRHDGAAMSGHVQDTIAMLKLADGFDCFAWASSYQQPGAPSPAKSNQLSMLAQAYKCATLLYGRQALGAETWGNDQLLSQLLDLVEFLQHDATLFKCLLWPIFIAGLASKDHRQQDAVTESLRRLWDSTNCLNVIGASKILRNFWKRNKQAGDQMQAMSKLEGLAHGWLLI
ncbi:hypothetical protein MY11210_009544 [Beauveria gryllotalpidicola]